jgi:choline dehydrogenase-like flavoprotein
LIYSSDDIAEREDKIYDLCIIGGGPSGICLGLELLYSGLTVCTLEGGDFEPSNFFDQLKRVQSPELGIRQDSRVRAFGGTSITWSGIVAPMDPIDLAGWPPEVNVATAINTRAYRYDLPHLSLFNSDDVSLLPWNSWENLTNKIFLRQVPPINFGKKYRYAYHRNDFDLIFGSVVVSLNSEKRNDRRLISSVAFRCASGKVGKVTAKIYVLAAGGIENVRLLLNSTDERGVALGNSYDQLGRGFMNHPKCYVGEVYFNDPLPVTHAAFRLLRRHFSGYVGFRMKESLQRGEGLLNPYLRLEPLHVDPAISRDLEPLFKARAAASSLIRPKSFGAISSSMTALKDVKGIIRALILYSRIWRVWHATKIKKARVRCFMDMDASRENRITLSEISDAVGVKIPIVKYEISQRALSSVTTLLQHFSRELRTLGIGKFVPYAWDLSKPRTWTDASHHLGGTPMGHDPQTSVVNPELRLHDVDNLYVTGGSVFPSGGNANPTLTMIGLSMTLADTIRASLPKSNGCETSTQSSDGRGIIIVGAGRRVAEDVVPAVEALGSMADIRAIYATRPSVIFGRQNPWDVKPIDQLSEVVVASASIIYVAVPQASLGEVMAALLHYDCHHIRLIIETPALFSKGLISSCARFRSVHVAEDSVALPWLPTLHASIDDMSPVQEVRFTQSAYRYHALALAKAICREELGRGDCIKVAYRLGKRSRLKLASGSTVVLDGLRDYAKGHLKIILRDGTAISSHPDTDIIIQCARQADCCIGFKVGTNFSHLSEIESQLIGRCTDSDNLVTKMLDFKRVGLYRLIKAIISNGSNYSLRDGLEDAEVDRALAGRHFYYGGGLLSWRTGPVIRKAQREGCH